MAHILLFARGYAQNYYLGRKEKTRHAVTLPET